MEGHFVHQAADGSLAVVGVFFNIGRANPSIAQILAARPLTSKNVNILAEQNFMVQALLPAERVFYAFKGSLTTPPCSEGVQWFLMQHPVELSAQQWAQLKQALPISNARPIQNRHGRAILLNTL